MDIRRFPVSEKGGNIGPRHLSQRSAALSRRAPAVRDCDSRRKWFIAVDIASTVGRSVEELMKSRIVLIAVVLIAVATCFSFDASLASPAGLLNKTVHISWFQQTPGVAVGTNEDMSKGRSVAVTLYVSGAGRVFAKVEGRTGQSTGERAIGPEGSAFRSEGTKLVGTLHSGSSNGATRIVVSFDGGFQSCNVDVILASPGGKPLEWTALNGVRAIATGHPKISSQSCAVSTGNPFAN
jgi:hypothetical protein